MKKTILAFTAAISLALFGVQSAHARGFGGAHPSGGESSGYHGSGESSGYHGTGESSGYHGTGESSGYHATGTESSGYHATGEASGYHATGTEASGYHATGAEASGYHATGAEASGYHASGYAAGGYAAGGYSASHAALPTDAGYGTHPAAAGAAGYAAGANHSTYALNGTHVAAQGAAVRNSYTAAYGAGAFAGGWYGAHPGAWNAAGWAGAEAWHPMAWAGAAAWFGWGADVQPIVYEYGNNITYQGDQVYYGDQPVATADQYYQQAATIAQSPPPAADQAADWTPLGVFGLVRNDQDQANHILQIAIDKSGAIGGNYVDLISDTTVPIHGSLDKKTQRVCWVVGTNKKNVAETGLDNLTKDEAPILIHTGADKTEQWLLVRLKQPPQPGSGQ